MVARGDIWWLETPNDKRRPVLIVTRTEAVGVLRSVVVAPVTSTMRDTQTNVIVGEAEGLDHESVASFDNLATVPKIFLTTRVGAIGVARENEICRALAALADC